MTFGERLRLARERLGLSQVEVAAACRTSQYMISYWERQPYAPNGKHLVALCRTLRVSPSYLLGLDHDLEDRDGIDVLRLLRGKYRVEGNGIPIPRDVRERVADILETILMRLNHEGNGQQAANLDLVEKVRRALVACAANYPVASDPAFLAELETQLHAALDTESPHEATAAQGEEAEAK